MGLFDFLGGDQGKRIKQLEDELDELRLELKKAKRDLTDSIDDQELRTNKLDRRLQSAEGSYYRLMRQLKDEIKFLGNPKKIIIEHDAEEKKEGE